MRVESVDTSGSGKSQIIGFGTGRGGEYVPTTSIKSTVSVSYSFLSNPSSVTFPPRLNSDRTAALARFPAPEKRLVDAFSFDGGSSGKGFSASPLDTGDGRDSPVDEDARSMRMLGCCCVLKADLTFLPIATTGFSVVEDGGGGCDEGVG